MADLTTLDDLTLADLPSGSSGARWMSSSSALGDGLDVVTLADIAEAIVDPITGEPAEGIEQQLVDAVNALNSTIADLDTLGDVPSRATCSPPMASRPGAHDRCESNRSWGSSRSSRSRTSSASRW